MRRVLGIVVLVAGLLGLGLWARSHQAPHIQHVIGHAAQTVAATSIHGVETRVSGRDITVTGLADTEAERQQLIAALDAVRGRRVVNDQLTVLPVATPFSLSVSKEEGKSVLTATGNVPTAAARSELAQMLGTDAGGLIMASGAPRGWTDMARAAIAALGPLDFGRAELTDGNLKVVGQARTPKEAGLVQAAVSGLPKDAVSLELSLLDDGKPADWTLDYSAGDGAKLGGKLPVGLDPAAIAQALGLPSVAGDPARALIGPEGGASVLQVLAKWLPQLESLHAAFTPGGADIAAGVSAGTDLDLAGEAMSADLAAAAAGGDKLHLKIEPAAAAGADGTHRKNAATGQDEVLSSGFWLPVVQITPSLEACKAAADGILAQNRINFLSGSDRLDGTGRAVINRLASVLLPCTRDGGLRALIGGHTDSTGDAQMNLGLSQRRAVTVRLALIDRGVPGTALRAQGYGDTQPVASNDTDDGKAANRRTTVEWMQ